MLCTQPAADVSVDDLAEALFCSSLQPSWAVSPTDVRAAVLASLHRHHDSIEECASELAERYGDDPDSACLRMRWCRDQVAGAYAG
jgi:hypothetical protein